MRYPSNIVFIAVMCWCCSANAQTTYKCAGDKGSVTFQDFPCKTAKAESSQPAIPDSMSQLADRCRKEDTIFYRDHDRCSAMKACLKEGRAASELSICTDQTVAKIKAEAAQKMEREKQIQKILSGAEACQERRRAAYVAAVRPLPTCD